MGNPFGHECASFKLISAEWAIDVHVSAIRQSADLKYRFTYYLQVFNIMKGHRLVVLMIKQHVVVQFYSQ
jgi:hypothetical protein